ncbi:MAG: thiamine pyrophosphate-binding protein [Bacillota bacterium]
MPTVSEVMAEFLHSAGTRQVFGVPGGDSLPFMEACNNRNVTFILANHETSAGFMADAYSLLSGKPGVCITTLGPGATNAVSAAAQAMLERSPVLFITAQLSRAHQGAMTHQFVDTEALFRPVTKWSFSVTPDNVIPVMRRALRTMYVGRPGPVHLSLAGDVATAEMPQTDTPITFPSDVLTRPSPAPDAIEDARRLVRSARRPLILAGLGIYHGDCSRELRQLVSSWEVPILYTPKIKGVVPEDSPWAAGSVGLGMSADSHMKGLISEADLVIAVGFDQVELVTGWRDALEPGMPLIWIDYLPCEDGIYHVDVGMIGDMKASLGALDETPCEFEWTAEMLQSHSEKVRQTLVGGHIPAPRCGLAPHRVTQIARSIIPPDTVVTSDVGAQKLMNSQLWESYLPGTYLLTNGFSSMGYGLPAAIAAALSDPKRRPVVCFCGDGGFSMTMHEMETVARLGLPVVVVVFSDCTLSLIEIKQRRRGFAPGGVRMADKDYVALARGFGICGYHATSEDELQTALTEAVEEAAPAIIGCTVDPAEYDYQL